MTNGILPTFFADFGEPTESTNPQPTDVTRADHTAVGAGNGWTAKFSGLNHRQQFGCFLRARGCIDRCEFDRSLTRTLPLI